MSERPEETTVDGEFVEHDHPRASQQPSQGPPRARTKKGKPRDRRSGQDTSRKGARQKTAHQSTAKDGAEGVTANAAQSKYEQAYKKNKRRFTYSDDENMNVDDDQRWERSQYIGQTLFDKNFDKTLPKFSLQRQVREAGELYMKNLKDQNLLAEHMKSPKKSREKMSELHEAYCGVMVYTALAPLKREINTNTVLEAVGCAAAMWIKSPAFRKHLTNQWEDSANRLTEGIEEKIRNRRNSKWERTSRKYDKAAEKADKKGIPLSDKWEKRLEKTYQNAQGRPMYTAESAALTEMALTESLYDNLRNPELIKKYGKDLIIESHEGLLDNLYAQAQRDGIEPDELATATRTLVGQQVLEHPEKAAVYSQLGHGKFVHTPLKTVRSKDGREQQIWDRGFVNALGDKIEEGVFTVREPMTAVEHQVEISDVMTADLAQAKTPDELTEMMMAYCVGSSDTAQVKSYAPVSMQKYVSRAESMKYSMRDDGLNEEQSRLVYSQAFGDALAAIPEVNPQLAHEWAAKYDISIIAEMNVMTQDQSKIKQMFAKYEHQGEHQDARQQNTKESSTQYSKKFTENKESDREFV